MSSMRISLHAVKKVTFVDKKIFVGFETLDFVVLMEDGTSLEIKLFCNSPAEVDLTNPRTTDRTGAYT